MSNVWCEHMKNKGDGLKLYKWHDDSIHSLGQSHTEYFQFCPICGTPRPKEKSLAEKFMDIPFPMTRLCADKLSDIASEHFKNK